MNNSDILNALYESDKELIIYRNSEKIISKFILILLKKLI